MSTLNNAVNDRYPQGYIFGLGIAFASTTTITLDLGAARDSTDALNINLATNQTINCATTGANGLDTGSLGDSHIYAVYVISGTSGTAGLASLSYSSPTMPSGYTVRRYVGSFATTAAGAIMSFIQQASGNVRTYIYDTTNTNTRVLNAGTATSFTGVSCTAVIPPTSQQALLSLSFIGNARADELTLRPTSSSSTTPTTVYNTSGISGSDPFIILATQCLNSSQSFDYECSSSSDSATIYVAGYIDSI
jgi:hypothetical protein